MNVIFVIVVSAATSILTAKFIEANPDFVLGDMIYPLAVALIAAFGYSVISRPRRMSAQLSLTMNVIFVIVVSAATSILAAKFIEANPDFVLGDMIYPLAVALIAAFGYSVIFRR